MFHEKCFLTWAEKSSHCPLCRESATAITNKSTTKTKSTKGEDKFSLPLSTLTDYVVGKALKGNANIHCDEATKNLADEILKKAMAYDSSPER